MATLTSFQEVWVKSAQDYLPRFVTGVSTLAELNFDSTIKSTGQTIAFPYMPYASIVVNDVNDRTDSYAGQYATSVKEILTVNKEKFINQNYPKGDLIQASYLTLAEYATRLNRRMAETVDTSVLGEIGNMAYSIDAGVIAGGASNGVPFAISTANAVEVPTEAQAFLTENNVPTRDLVMITDARSMAKFNQNLVNRDASQSVTYSIDGSPTSSTVKSVDNGYAGMVQGIRSYVSNNLPSRSLFTYSGQPTAGETITYRGVVITFVAALTSASNEVLIDASADATYANLASFFNDQLGVNAPVATATHTGLSTSVATLLPTSNIDPISDFETIKRAEVSATQDLVGNTVLLSSNGGGKARITDAASNVVLTTNYILGYFGVGNTIKLAMQTPSTGNLSVIRDIPNSPMSQAQLHMLYGVLAPRESRQLGGQMLITA